MLAIHLHNFVTDNVEPGTPTDTIYVKEGDTVKVDCSLPHSSTDQMKWYKVRYKLEYVFKNKELKVSSINKTTKNIFFPKIVQTLVSEVTKEVNQIKLKFS